jgi:hypothetical protein
MAAAATAAAQGQSRTDRPPAKKRQRR